MVMGGSFTDCIDSIFNSLRLPRPTSSTDAIVSMGLCRLESVPIYHVIGLGSMDL
jgi:hypothetical protein